MKYIWNVIILKRRLTCMFRYPFRKSFVLLFLILAPLYLFPGGQNETAVSSAPAGDSVAVSILPMKYFVDRITGGTLEVTVIVPPGKSPATYEPSPRQINALAETEIFFTIGVPFERAFVPTISSNLPNLRIIDTSEGIKKMAIQNHLDLADSEIHHDEHEASDEHDHDHDLNLPDPHIWLSPQLVMIQTENIYQALLTLHPDKKEDYAQNYQGFMRDLEALDDTLSATLSPVKGSSILVYHPSFGYFADAYGLKQIPIELGGNEPSPKVLEQVISLARDKNIEVIFVQPEFNRSSAEAVAAAIDGAVVEVAPLKPDYLENMYDIAEKIKAGLSH